MQLYFFADAMDHRNFVTLELIEGRNSITYKVTGFTHSLNVNDQFQNQVVLFNTSD